MENFKKIKTHIQPALDIAKKENISVVEAIRQLIQIDEEAVIEHLGFLFQYRVIDNLDDIPQKPAFDIISYHDLLRMNVYLCHREGLPLLALIADPFDNQTISSVKLRTKIPVEIALTTNTILQTILQYYEKSLNLFENLTPSPEDNNTLKSITLQSINKDSSPIIRTVNSILYQGFRDGASDIHLESIQNGMILRYRMDGILIEINQIQGVKIAQQIISSLKVMAELDITEQRVPQDGRLQVTIDDKQINFRVSIMPNIFGEDAVLRILDKRHFTESLNALSLDSLGLSKSSISAIRYLAQKSYGMTLMTGPTGSGKTTTLYAIISEIHDGKDKIITIEDPVEYQIDGILQIPVYEKKGLTFAKGLRSILRHDPDKILVGEIRDHATATIAIQSALTGHSVFSTVHANNLFDVIGRFTYMGIDLFNFISALNGIVAQRLVRLICNECKVESASKHSKCQLLTKKINAPYIGQGCEKCKKTGYYGRRAVAEIMILDDTIRDMVIQKYPIHHIRQHAFENGVISFEQQMRIMAENGEISLAEYTRHNT